MPSSEPRFEILPATHVSQDRLAAFYRELDPRKAAHRAAHWRWLYRVDDPDSISPPLLAIADGEIIGHAGLVPVRVRSQGEVRKAIWFVDFWVLPRFQRGGFGTRLTRAWMELCPLHITFCNENSLGVFKKLGWSWHYETRAQRILLHPERHPELRRIERRVAGAAAGLVMRAVQRARVRRRRVATPFELTPSTVPLLLRRHDPRVHVERDEGFLRWRLLECPMREELIGLRVGAHATVARVIRRAGYGRVNLLTVAGDSLDRDGLSDLFAGVVRWADEAGLDEVHYMSSHLEIARAASAWLPLPSRALFAMHARDDEGLRFLERALPLWESIDSDVDTAQLGDRSIEAP